MSKTAINQDARTVEVAFSTESPVEDWPGVIHILDHGAKSVDLSRLNDGAPVYLNHDHTRQVGVVERAWLGDDRVGRALLRFSKANPEAEHVWADIVDGVRRHVSVGADILDREAVTRDPSSTEKKPVWRILSWQPKEISIAGAPADMATGIGRSNTNHQERITVEITQDTLELERQKARRTEAKAVSELYAIGEQYQVMDMAREFAASGRTTESDILELRRAAFDAYSKRREEELDKLERGEGAKPVTAIGMSDKEIRKFSVTRALNAVLDQSWKGAEFERECSDHIAETLDRDARGFFVPWEIQVRRYDQRARSIRREMTTGGAATGAEYVADVLSPENFIEQLRQNVVVARLGGRMLPGLRGNLDIPKKTSGATFAWLAESGTVTLSDLGTGNLLLTPKTVGGGVQASRRMLKQSVPAIDDLIMMDLNEGAAEIIDLGALQGTGASNQPTGVFNTSGVNTQAIVAAGNPTYAEAVGFRTAVATDSALRGSLGFCTTSAVVGNMMTRALDAGSGRFLMDPVLNPNRALGYPVEESNQLTASRIIFGNWAEVLIAMWGVLDLRPDPYTAANADALIIRAFQDIDVGVRHAVSFCVNV